MKKSNLFGYKPSAWEYTEMCLIAIFLLSHFLPWASLTVNGESLLSFVPCSLFGKVFTFTIFVVFLVSVAMKFVGRFSGMTLLIVIHMGILVYASHVAMEHANMMLEQMKGWAEIASGFSNMFGSMAGGTTSNTTAAITSSTISISRSYYLFGFLTIILAFLLFATWFSSLFSLAMKHRCELTRGYYIGILGYLLVGGVGVLAAKLSYKSIDQAFELDNAIAGVVSIYPMIVCIVVAVVMLIMLLVNIIVVLLLELLREWRGAVMWIWSLVAALVFAVLFYLLINVESNLFISSPFDGLEKFFKQESEDIGKWFLILIAKLLVLTGLATSLMRSIYYGFLCKKETNSETSETLETEQVEASDNKLIETPRVETHNRKKLYIGGTIIGAFIVVGLSLWLIFTGNSSNNPLGVEKPTWKKFVVVTSRDVTLHKEARLDSPQLMEALENLESDMAAREFRWEDQGKKRGYTLYPYNLEKNRVLPVLDEADTWYKVQVYDDMSGMTETAYVQKEWTREIKPEPITEEVLARVSGNQQRLDHIIKSGKLRNLCLTTRYNELDGESFQVGALIDGILVYPQCKGVFLRREGGSGVNLQKNEEYDNYVLVYGEDHETSLNEYTKLFDPRKLNDEKVSQIFESINQVNPSAAIEVEYYFPEANQDYFFKFLYTPAGRGNVSPTSNDAEETKVTGYHAEDRGDGQVLFAEFGSAKEDTGVDFLGPLVEVADLDGDGNMDALVQNGLPGSSGIYNYSVVYFDETSDNFKTTEDDIETMSESPTIVDWENRKCIAVSDGIQIERYVLESPKLRVIKTEKGDVGKIVKQITIGELFDTVEHDAEPVEREISADINGDGVNEIIVFSHGDYHAYAFGDYMGLERIRWADGSFTDGFGAVYTGDKFDFLQNKTNGLPDILVRELYLFRWSGSAYEQWNWDGTEFVKGGE